MDVKEKLAGLIAKAKLSMWGKSGLSSELAINTYIAEYLITHGVTAQEWIPVTDRLPEEGEDVLAFGYWHEFFQPLICHYSPVYKGRWFTKVAGQEVYSVTHWMPLPQPPKEE